MKKLLIVFCLMVFPVFAQEISDNTFTENNPNLIRDGESHTFNGGAFVYIQGISDKPQPKTWMDHMKIKLFGSMDIPDGPKAPHLTDTSSFKNPSEVEIGVQTKSFFGTEKEIKYVPHTSSWNFIIQPMDSYTVSIQENIQLLLTEDTHIERSWPISKEKLTIIKAQINGKNIQINPNEEISNLKLGTLPAGLYTVNLHYTLYSPIKDDFSLPLANDNWPLVTDDFSGVILNGKIGFSQPTFLLGKNLQEIPENFVFQADEQGNIFFRNTHILPAFTQIHLSTKVSDNAPQQKNTAIFSISNSLIFIIAFVIIILYLVFSGIEIYFASLAYLLKRFRHTSQNRFKNWIYRMGEIFFGSFILLICLLLISLFFNIHLTYIQWISLILLVVIGISCLDIFVFYPKQKMIYGLHQNKGEK